jgi:hypothetical protein
MTFWIIFVCLKYIGLDLDLRESFKKKTPTNIGELQHMKYICMKNCIHTSKLGLWVEFFGEFFCDHYYWYTSIELKAIWKFKIFGWKFVKNMCFFHFFQQ